METGTLSSTSVHPSPPPSLPPSFTLLLTYLKPNPKSSTKKAIKKVAVKRLSRSSANSTFSITHPSAKSWYKADKLNEAVIKLLNALKSQAKRLGDMSSVLTW